jgi:membrane associated rhomboid family serine protease
LIPVRDSTPRRGWPIVNMTLIASCIGVFVLELRAGDELPLLIDEYALIPARLFARGDQASFLWLPIYSTLFTSTFLHAGGMHLASNLLFLWIFGDNASSTCWRTRPASCRPWARAARSPR